MRSYVLGCELVFATQFSDPITGAPAVPTSVTLSLQGPTGDIVTPAVSTGEPGTYKALFTPPIAGVWRVRWQGAGAVMAATETEFEVKPSAFAAMAMSS